ncbi:hypothetical protein D5b_00180 [Faustovirus]|nr:hypothetical protein D5b_00180 [Faustovirus]AMN84733.1 hypothetical protein D6_00331 [Faustovirus]AMP44135.1 hypothetical protein PRJ_Dakar_00178 [Faustovirus]
MDPTKWLVLRKQNGTTQCFADPKDAAKCLSLANKIDADDMVNYAMIQDLIKIKNNLPVDMYAVVNCTDSMRSDPAHWCNMFG